MTETPTHEDVQTLVDDLARQRDELRLKLHLAKAEARDEWHRLEKQWDHLRGRVGVLGREAGGTAQEVAAAWRLAVEEIRQGYRRIRELL